MLRPGTFALTLLLSMLTGLGPLTVDMYLASLPEIGRVLNAPASQVQLTISFYLAGFAISQLLYGPFSDRHGRKPVLLVAMSIYLAATIACALAPTIEALIAARFVQALGGSGSIVLARAVARDMIAHYGLKPGMKVLDVGCGKGFLVKDLMLECPGLEAFGLDVSLYALQHAQPETIGRLHLGSGDSLPFPDGSFDCVTIGFGLRNVTDKDAALRSMYTMETVSDAAIVGWRSRRGKGWEEAPVIDFKGANATEVWVGRHLPSRHNLSAPDMVFGKFEGESTK